MKARSVKHLLEDIDSYELSEWEAYDRLEPIDHAMRAELSAGITASTIANCNRGKDSDPFTAADFMQKWGDEYRDHEAYDEAKRQQMAAKLEAFIQMNKLSWETGE